MAEPHAPQPVNALRFDRLTWNQLASIDLRLLEELAYLSRLTRQRSPTNATYCYPGRAWLATRTGASIRTVTRHVAKLAQLGLLTRLQRRPTHGRWQTNLYRLIHPMAWAAARVRQLITHQGDRRTQTAHLASSLKRRVDGTNQAEALRAIIARGLAKFAPE